MQGHLVYFLPAADCGYSISASLAIVKTIKGDYIRILQLCDTTKVIRPNTIMKLFPNKSIITKASIIPIDSTNDCKIKSTFYGHLVYQYTTGSK